MGYHSYPNYVLIATLSAADPLDSNTYLIGQPSALSVTGATCRIYIPRSGTIRAVYISWSNVTQDCTTENTTFKIIKNAATVSNTIYTGSFAHANTPKSIDNLNFAVSKGDYIHLTMATPAWVTNPTGVYLTAVIEVQC